MIVSRFFIALVAVAALGLITAAAAGLGPVTSAALGAGGTDVFAPPVEVTDVEWDIEWEDGSGFVVDGVSVEFTFTEAFTGRLTFHVALTGDAPLPLTHDEQKLLDVGVGDTTTVTASFESSDIPVEALEGLHLLVCDWVAGDPVGRCSLP